ncbi:multidrug resistance-associated protein 1-like [Oncorhynchus tshawytscha]|uniref:ABC-type glutathione-S-conjugate transporter n=1 Tax=Oncorhynchus tshawytscha TaxID=74940 RepID=A0AAZ3R1V7_ONCTS|nr:multidrug resistance-associated protein 1-like [Oncorhynchus tshawytscha]
MDNLCSLSGLDPLWDWNLTWYTPHPDLSQCFQHTVLVWFPCMYLWSCGPLYLVYLWFTGQGGISLTSLCCAKTVLGLCLVSFGFLEVFYVLVERSAEIHQHMVFLLSPVIRSLTMLLAVCVIQWERMKGCRSSVLLFLFWTLAVVCSLVPLRANIQQIIEEGFFTDAMRFIAFFVYFSLQLTQLILSCFSDQRPSTDTHTYRKNPCPVEDASFLSKMLFWWFGGLVIRGYRTPLQAEDLWCLREEDSSDCIIADLEIDWARECTKLQQKECSLSGCRPTGPKLTEQTQLLKKLRQEQNSGFCLFRVLARSFGPFFLKGTLFLIFHDAFMFSIPQVLSLLLGFMCDQDSDLWKGFMFAFLLFLLSSLQSLFNHQYMYSCFTVGMRVKTAVMGLVYRKSLVISSAARQSCTVGEIVNLVSADTQKLMDMVVYFNAVWLAPIEIALCLYFLWQLLGPSALAGIATVILIFPLNGFIAKMRSKLQEVQMRYTDSRIKLMNEILSGIKILKFYAWEQAFLERVLGYREKELNALKRSQVLYSISIASFNSSSFLIAFSMFGVYVLVDDKNILDAQKVFVSMALIHILKTPLSQLPFAMSTTMQAVVSLRRLGKFLCQDELKPDDVDREPYSPDGDGVVIDSGTFGWSKEGPPCLMRINVRVKKGSLVAVVGHVGSGKSSLLSAMLGETEKRSGHVSVKGSVAYVPQQAWIQNATLKDNIVFGQERKESWYRRVVEACALLPDLEILPAGDGTEIGEKGLNLSGGQKQRVSLARAVYRKADVYLLDDPLSAVDTHVGQHIFERVFGAEGLLKDQTRVLVTHGLSFLPQADLILVLVEGEITEMGSYLELMARDGAFAEFIRLFAGNERKERSHRGTRKSVSRLSMTDFSIDLSQEQLISGDMMSSASIQTMEAISDTEDQKQEVLGKLTEADKANTGRVKLEMYVEYFRTIGLALIIPIVFLYAFQQAASLAYNYWLSVWADDPIINGTQIDTDLKLGVFGALGFAQGVSIFGTTVAISLGGIIASRHLHLDLLNNVLRSPMAFFEVTPSGNLLNRFSKEVDAIDCMIPDGLKMMLGYLFKLLEVCIIVLVAMPFAGVVLLPLTLLYAFIQSFYVATSCQLRRLEAVSRSPIYTHFNETVQGASVVRAFSEQERFILQANGRIDHNQTAYFPRFVATRWLAVNLEFLGNLLVLAAATLAVMGRDTLSPGIVGLAVSHSLQVTGILSWIVRSWTDVENNIVSVERVKEYADTPKEAPWTIEGSMLPLAWPTHGTIELEEYGLQYRKGLDWALKGISLSIQEKEKVGIVGRTGAGKSSLALGIFRILEAAKGEIYIDGINIAQIGLHELRSRITIIPQDPVLFSGSLRMNLDPFDGYSDEEVWRALELSHLKSFVSCLPDKLNHECSEGGENLSLGQRQLVCLARALLRKTKILVLDEATAAVDLETDNLIQSTIRTQFDDCTVLTIAHRLNTIMDYTRVIVMDRGLITEMDSPSNLISERGQFYLMCREAGLV